MVVGGVVVVLCVLLLIDCVGVELGSGFLDLCSVWYGCVCCVFVGVFEFVFVGWLFGFVVILGFVCVGDVGVVVGWSVMYCVFLFNLVMVFCGGWLFGLYRMWLCLNLCLNNIGSFCILIFSIL